jgi:hypothetical protein
MNAKITGITTLILFATEATEILILCAVNEIRKKIEMNNAPNNKEVGNHFA